MNLNELKDHIRIECSQGETRENVTNELLEHGVRAAEISKAFSELDIEEQRKKDNNKIKPAEELPKMGEIFAQAGSLMKIHLSAFLPIAAALSIISVGVNWLEAKYHFSERVFKFTPWGNTEMDLISLISSLGFMIIILMMVTFCIVTVYVVLRDTKERLTITEAMARAALMYWRYLITSIFSMVAILFGLLLFVIPGVIFAGWFLFASLIALEGEEFGARAMEKGKELVVGRWWEIMKRFIAIEMVVLLISLPFMFNVTSAGEFSWLQTVSELVLAFVISMIEIFGSVSFYVLYRAAQNRTRH